MNLSHRHRLVESVTFPSSPPSSSKHEYNPKRTEERDRERRFRWLILLLPYNNFFLSADDAHCITRSGCNSVVLPPHLFLYRTSRSPRRTRGERQRGESAPCSETTQCGEAREPKRVGARAPNRFVWCPLSAFPRVLFGLSRSVHVRSLLSAAAFVLFVLFVLLLCNLGVAPP